MKNINKKNTMTHIRLFLLDVYFKKKIFLLISIILIKHIFDKYDKEVQICHTKKNWRI